MKKISLILFLSVSFCQAFTNFHEVIPGISRGARPTQQDVVELGRLGYKTILDIENDKKFIHSEEKYARDAGIHFISVPLSGFWAPKDRDMTQIQEILNDPRNYPIFIHCQHGQDRTGLAIGLYRVFTQRWKSKDAYAEMLKLGFHPSLVFLDHYFKEKSKLPH